METIRLEVGSYSLSGWLAGGAYRCGHGGVSKMPFQGELLAAGVVRDEWDADGMFYTAEVLYRTDDGRYLVHSIEEHSTDPDDLPDDCFAPARHSGVRFDLGRSIGGSYDLEQAS